MSVTWNEPDNAPRGADGTTNDIVHDEDTFRLCAEREGREAGAYTITYQVTDPSGKSTTQSAVERRPAGAGLR